VQVPHPHHGCCSKRPGDTWGAEGEAERGQRGGLSCCLCCGGSRGCCSTPQRTSPTARLELGKGGRSTGRSGRHAAACSCGESPAEGCFIRVGCRGVTQRVRQTLLAVQELCERVRGGPRSRPAPSCPRIPPGPQHQLLKTAPGDWESSSRSRADAIRALDRAIPKMASSETAGARQKSSGSAPSTALLSGCLIPRVYPETSNVGVRPRPDSQSLLLRLGYGNRRLPRPEVQASIYLIAPASNLYARPPWLCVLGLPLCAGGHPHAKCARSFGGNRIPLFGTNAKTPRGQTTTPSLAAVRPSSRVLSLACQAAAHYTGVLMHSLTFRHITSTMSSRLLLLACKIQRATTSW